MPVVSCRKRALKPSTYYLARYTVFRVGTGPAISGTRRSRPPIASEIQNHVKMVQSACGEPRRSLRDKHEGGSDEQTRFHPSEHRGTCSRHDPCRWQREGGG